jgi:hypothetical protein
MSLTHLQIKWPACSIKPSALTEGLRLVAIRYLYFSYLRGHSRLFRVLNRYIHFSDIFYSRHALAALLNAVRCETHREVVETILSNIR